MASNLALTPDERTSLLSVTRSRTAPAAEVKRARLIMMLDEGLSWSVIAECLPCSPQTATARQTYPLYRCGTRAAGEKGQGGRPQSTKPGRRGFESCRARQNSKTWQPKPSP